jgi:Protein kinase domain
VIGSFHDYLLHVLALTGSAVARQPLPKDTELRGRYRVETVLGAGGFGITYVGLDLHLNRAIAIKEYFPAEHAQREGHYSIRSLDSGNRQFFALGRTWFLREARTLAKYHHPNIVGVMDHFEENNTAYMILRFEEGHSLSRWLRSLGRAPTQFEVDSFMLPILSALETMHKNNDMHRDVAMDNIILRPSGDPVLIDFGSARQAIGAHSRSIDAVVKFGYSPPEQYSVDTRLQGPWSDVYALASTLHLAITGRLPPDAPGRQLDDIYERLATSDIQGYRIGLLEGIDWGLALKPAQRPQSISDWRRTLLKSSSEPLEEDPVEVLNSATAPATGTLRTPAPGTFRPDGGPTAAAGTVFIAQTQAHLETQAQGKPVSGRPAPRGGQCRQQLHLARCLSGHGIVPRSRPPAHRRTLATPVRGRATGKRRDGEHRGRAIRRGGRAASLAGHGGSGDAVWSPRIARVDRGRRLRRLVLHDRWEWRHRCHGDGLHALASPNGRRLWRVPGGLGWAPAHATRSDRGPSARHGRARSRVAPDRFVERPRPALLRLGLGHAWRTRARGTAVARPGPEHCWWSAYPGRRALDIRWHQGQPAVRAGDEPDTDWPWILDTADNPFLPRPRLMPTLEWT